MQDPSVMFLTDVYGYDAVVRSFRVSDMLSWHPAHFYMLTTLGVVR